jgi:hypothetical protein
MDEVPGNILAGGSDLVKPLDGGRLLLNVIVGRVDGEDALSSGDTLGSGLMSIVKVDAEDFGKAVANFAARRGHVGQLPLCV